MADYKENDGDNFVPEVVSGQIVPIDEIPSAVCGCIKNLSGLEQKVRAATERAMVAQDQAGDAARVKLAWYKIGDKAEAIRALQSAMSGMSQAQIDQSDAMKAMLEYQRAIAKAMQFLLGLGVGSLNANRTVYKAIQMQMQGASAEELDEMARQELKNTLAQLKTQQDIFVQQERTKDAVKVNQKSIKNINKLDEAQEKELARQRNKDDEHDARLDALTKHMHRMEAEMRALKGEAGVNETDFKDAPLPSSVPSTRAWCRSSDEKLIAGVCAGVARKMSLNVWALRIILVAVAAFTMAIPALLYIVAIFVLKPASTKSWSAELDEECGRPL